MKRKILVADDEPGVLSLLKDYFEMNGYLVYTACNGEEAVRQVDHAPDVILLDINVPKMDGLEVCRRIREHVPCPIIFLTARVEDMDKISGFVSGGDDYVTKPFSIDELGARVAAHLRRESRRTGNAQVRFSGELVIDYRARTVSLGDREISLAKKEFDIIELLSKNRGQVFDKERIYELLWVWDAQGGSSVVAEHIKRIRAKLKASGAQDCIELVLSRYLALVTAVMLPVLVMGLISTCILGFDYGWANIDALAYAKYALDWILPTAMAATAVGMFFTVLTGTPIGIAVQLIWRFVDTIGGNSAYSFFGTRPLQLMPRHNSHGNTKLFMEYLPSLIQNRICIAAIAVVPVALTVIAFDAKREGWLDEFAFKRRKVQSAV